MQGHGVNVYAVAHPQTCDNCDKEFFSVDSLQGHVADVHENGEPMYEDQTEALYKSGHNLGRAAYPTQIHQATKKLNQSQQD